MESKCQRCGQEVPGFDSVSVTYKDGSKNFCNRCFNEIIATEWQIDFHHPEFLPLILLDVDGGVHTFHFRTWFTPVGTLAIDGFELIDGQEGGHQYCVRGDPEEDPRILFKKLYERMKRELARKHIEETDHGLQITDLRTVRAIIGCDLDQDPTLPMLVIDGRNVRWQEFGRMLMTCEGWRFKLQVYGNSEEM